MQGEGVGVSLALGNKGIEVVEGRVKEEGVGGGGGVDGNAARLGEGEGTSGRSAPKSFVEEVGTTTVLSTAAEEEGTGDASKRIEEPWRDMR
jgi:hypothetical protein